MVTITTPKYSNYLSTVFEAMNYFSAKRYQSVFYNKDKYCLAIYNRCIKIDMIDESEKTIEEINDFLSYMFFDKYIGIDESHHHLFHPKNVETYSI